MLTVEYIDNEVYRGRFNSYKEAAQFIMLAGEYKAPISINQIIKMLQVSKLTGLPFMGNWCATA